jgi:hypothetical protein
MTYFLRSPARQPLFHRGRQGLLLLSVQRIWSVFAAQRGKGGKLGWTKKRNCLTLSCNIINLRSILSLSLKLNYGIN